MTSTRTTTLRIAQAAREWRAMREDNPDVIVEYIPPQPHAATEPCTGIYDQDDGANRTRGTFSVTRSPRPIDRPIRSFRGGYLPDPAREQRAADMRALLTFKASLT